MLRCILSTTSFLPRLLLSSLRPHQTAVINKMVPLKDIQGKVYKFKSRSECFDSGMLALDVTDVVRRHMVLVVDIVPGKLDCVKVMTVSTQIQTSHLLRSTSPDHLDIKGSRRLYPYRSNTEEGLCNPASTSKLPRMVSRKRCSSPYYTAKVFISKD